MVYYPFTGILVMALLIERTTRCLIRKRWIRCVVEQVFNIKSVIPLKNING